MASKLLGATLVVVLSCVSYAPGIEVPLVVRAESITLGRDIGTHRIELSSAYLWLESISLESCPGEEPTMALQLLGAGRVQAHELQRGQRWDVIHMSGLPPLEEILLPAPGRYCGLRVIAAGRDGEPAIEASGRIDGEDFSILNDQEHEWIVPFDPIDLGMDANVALELSLDAVRWAPLGDASDHRRIGSSFEALVRLGAQ